MGNSEEKNVMKDSQGVPVKEQTKFSQQGLLNCASAKLCSGIKYFVKQIEQAGHRRGGGLWAEAKPANVTSSAYSKQYRQAWATKTSRNKLTSSKTAGIAEDGRQRRVWRRILQGSAGV